jgi:enoyl-CoA hydratase/carnithine racemase
VGWGKAAELIYTGEPLTAGQAESLGLIQRAVPIKQLDQAVEDWVVAILKAGPQAIRLQKQLLAEWQVLAVDQAISRGIETFAEAYRTDEPRLMMEKFLTRKRD